MMEDDCAKVFNIQNQCIKSTKTFFIKNIPSLNCHVTNNKEGTHNIILKDLIMNQYVTFRDNKMQPMFIGVMKVKNDTAVLLSKEKIYFEASDCLVATRNTIKQLPE